MQITLATYKDIDSLCNIWRICFTDDIIFLNLFFKHCFPLARTYVFKDEGIVVSSVTIIPISKSGQEELMGGYLYGVCTLPKYRGHSLSLKLIDYAEEDCRERNLSFIVTRPATPSLFAIYRKIGFSQPIFRQTTLVTLPIDTDGSSFTELSAKRLNILRNGYLGGSYFSWSTPVLEYIMSYYKRQNGSIVELESERYMVGYPDEEDNELYHILELGNNSDKLNYPTLHLVANYIKSRHAEKTKAKIHFPSFIHYSDIQMVEKEVFALLKPLSADIHPDTFFNFCME